MASSAVQEKRSEFVTACAINGMKHVAVKCDQWDLVKPGKGRKKGQTATGTWTDSSSPEWERESHHQGGWRIGKVVALTEGTTTAKAEHKHDGSCSKEDEALTRSECLLVTDDPNDVKCGKWTALRVANDFSGGESLNKRRRKVSTKGVSRGPAQSEAGSTNNTRTSSRISKPPGHLEVHTT